MYGRLRLYHQNTYFVSDTHFWHRNIIQYCKRPFASVEEMNARMMQELLVLDHRGAQIVHLGDWQFTPKFVPPFKYPENHILISGNHDRDNKDFYAPWFGIVLGKPRDYQTTSISAVLTDAVNADGSLSDIEVLLSHGPLTKSYGDSFHYQYNLHGHVHDRSLDSEWHVNCSVEVNEYKPRTLLDMLNHRQTVKPRNQAV